MTGGSPVKVTEGAYDRALQVSADGRTLVVARQATDRPVDLFALSGDGAVQRQLTHQNRELLSRLALQPAESFWATGAEGGAGPGLRRAAAGLRPVPDIPGGVPHPWRSSGRLDRLVELPLEPQHVRRPRLCGGGREPPWEHGLRAGVHGPDHRRLGRQGVRRPDGRARPCLGGPIPSSTRAESPPPEPRSAATWSTGSTATRIGSGPSSTTTVCSTRAACTGPPRSSGSPSGSSGGSRGRIPKGSSDGTRPTTWHR